MANQIKKQNTAGGGLYIALAICILSVICIGVYSSVISIFSPGPEETPPADDGGGSIVDVPRNTGSVDVIEPEPEPDDDVDLKPNPNETPDQSVNATPTPPGYTMPVAGSINKPFSNDVLVYSETMNDYRVHNGVDLNAALGTPVKAFTDGTVSKIYEDPLMGQTVVIDHANNTQSIYQNLSVQLPAGLTVGSTVKEGQVIGGVGETVLIECAQEPHLHFEVLVQGKHVDPMAFFS